MTSNESPMRILHFISAPAAGGAEICVKALSRALLRRNCQVSIGFLEHGADSGRDQRFEADFLRELDAIGVGYFFVGKGARRKPWLGAFRVRQYVAKKKIDIYHSHLTYGKVFGCLLGIPKVYTQHSIAPRLNRWFYSLLALFVDQQIAVSDICAKNLESFSGRPVVTINNGVDLQRFHSGKVRVVGSTDVVNCICVGRISEPKNYGLLVRAIQRLPENIKARLQVRIAGEGSPGQTLELSDAIEKANLQGCIELLGGRDDIPDLLRDAHIFVMSSSREGQPIALLEACVSGLPCVVTDVGGNRDVVEACSNGILTPADDPRALASALEQLVRNPALLNTLSGNAVANSGRFSIEESCRRHLQLYRQLLR